MAHASWLSKNKSGGSGEGSVTFWGTSANTGRNARTTTVTFHASGVTPDPTVTATQQGKPLFVSFNSENFTVEKTGGSIEVRGTSNAKKLNFTLNTYSEGMLDVTVPSSYSAGGTTTNNNTAIANDPGGTEEFAFTISFTGIGANTGIAELVRQLTVTPYKPDESDPSQYVAGTAATCNLKQAAGDPTLSVNPSSITIAWDATTQQTGVSVAVTSNTTWTVA